MKTHKRLSPAAAVLLALLTAGAVPGEPAQAPVVTNVVMSTSAATKRAQLASLQREKAAIFDAWLTQTAPQDADRLDANAMRIQALVKRACRLGQAFIVAEVWDDALACFRFATEQDEERVDAWFGMGVAYGKLDESRWARYAYSQAISRQPGQLAARYNLALLYQAEHERGKALDQAREMLAEEPKGADGLYLLGYIYSGDPLTSNEARQAFLRFLELAPHDARAGWVRGWLEQKQGATALVALSPSIPPTSASTPPGATPAGAKP